MSTDQSFFVIPMFAVLYLVLHLIFKVSIEAVCLWAIVINWLLLFPCDPLLWMGAVGSLLVGAFIGFRVVPVQAISGLGLPRWVAADHIQFDTIANRLGSAEFRESRLTSVVYLDIDLFASENLKTISLITAASFGQF